MILMLNDAQTLKIFRDSARAPTVSFKENIIWTFSEPAESGSKWLFGDVFFVILHKTETRQLRKLGKKIFISKYQARDQFLVRGSGFTRTNKHLWRLV